MAGIGTLASGIAHDFNNMLGAILGAAALLKSRAQGNPVYDRYCTMIEQAGNRAAGLVRQLLQFSQKNIMNFTATSLNEIIAETVQILERSIGKETRIKLALDDRLHPINADAQQMQQVLMNLALNARDAMPEGGVLSISTETRILNAEFCHGKKGITPGLFVVLAVHDTGTGIPDEYLHKIFEPFFSTKGIGKGTGLGLAVVYGIVQRHRGYIDVESKVGEGTEFTVYLPVSEMQMKSLDPEPDQPNVEQGEGTILLVDDEKLVLQTHTEFLESLGYTVFIAHDGATAVKIFQEHHHQIDLTIIDLAMPEMDGIETLRQLQRFSPDIPAFFISGYSEEQRYQAALAQGALGYIHKPFNHRRFSQQIKQAIQKQIKNHESDCMKSEFSLR